MKVEWVNIFYSYYGILTNNKLIAIIIKKLFLTTIFFTSFLYAAIFFRKWEQIRVAFNSSSLRSVPSEVLQLQKLATKIRSTQRRNVDSFEKNTKCNDSNFKKSCSQTGGGAGDDFPPGKEYLFPTQLY